MQLSNSHLDFYGGTSSTNLVGRLVRILLEVLVEEGTKLGNFFPEAVVPSSPGISWVQEFRWNTSAGLGYLEVEGFVILVLNLGKLSRVDGVKDSTSVLQSANC